MAIPRRICHDCLKTAKEKYLLKLYCNSSDSGVCYICGNVCYGNWYELLKKKEDGV